MQQTFDLNRASKVTIIGLGAVGGLIAARLAISGHKVSALARGQTLSAVRKCGLRVIEPGENSGTEKKYQVDIAVVESTEDLEPQDLVVVAVKGPGLLKVVDQIRPLLADHTVVISAMNGLPWWFFERSDSVLTGQRLLTVDPDGQIADAIPAKNVLGGVVMWTSSCPEPGVIKLGLGNRFTLGEALGGYTPRLEAVANIFTKAGFDVIASSDIHKDVWYKLWGNMTANPISAMTGATYDRLIADPLVMRFAYDCMGEAAKIGSLIGCPIEQSGEQLMVEAGRRLGAFKTSMLQDVEAGRHLELDTLLGSVREVGSLVNVPTPCIDALFGLVRLHARTHGLYD